MKYDGGRAVPGEGMNHATGAIPPSDEAEMDGRGTYATGGRAKGLTEAGGDVSQVEGGWEEKNWEGW